MTEFPLISIIIPVYNREELVKISVESLLSQTYLNWEALIVDDGSSDNTVEIIRAYAESDSRIKLFRRNTLNKGGNVCRNIGLKESKGVYVIFLDSDDKLMPFSLQQRYKVSLQYPEYDFWVFRGVQSLLGKEYAPDNLLISSYEGCEEPLDLFLNHDFLWQTTGPMYKRERLISKGIFFDERIQVHQDVLFHITVLCRGLRFYQTVLTPDYFWILHQSGHAGLVVNVSILTSDLCYVQQIMFELKSNHLYKKKYNTFFLQFLLRDLNRYAIYVRNKENVHRILDLMRELDILGYSKIKLLYAFSLCLLLIPNQFLRGKITSMFYLCVFPNYNKRKYFLVKNISDYEFHFDENSINSLSDI